MFLIDRLNQENINIVSKYLKGKRLKKFQESVSIINESLYLQGWIKRGSVKAKAGFNQGLFSKLADYEVFDDIHDNSDEFYKVYRCFKYGLAGASVESIKKLNPNMFLKYPTVLYKAWIELCNEKEEAFTVLNSFRVLPEITSIGLSPKVTATLTEMNLDLDINSIKMAKLVPKVIPATDLKGKKIKDKNTGQYLLTTIYVLQWSKDILHNQSRFAHDGRCCHACGKQIPSQRFVPVEAFDKNKKQLISMWLGQDCAKNIFGIKDVGIKKE